MDELGLDVSLLALIKYSDFMTDKRSRPPVLLLNGIPFFPLPPSLKKLSK